MRVLDFLTCTVRYVVHYGLSRKLTMHLIKAMHQIFLEGLLLASFLSVKQSFVHLKGTCVQYQ